MEFKLDVHSHTIASGHAFGTVSEMAAAAAESGFELFGNMPKGFREPVQTFILRI